MEETNSSAAPAGAIALVEWNWRGHHPTYFAHFVLALAQLRTRVLAICPHPEEAKGTVARLAQTLAPLSDCSRVEFRQFPQVRSRRWLPSRLHVVKHAIDHFRTIDRVIRQWQSSSGITKCEIFFACMYQWDFEHFRYARPFLSSDWAGLYMRPLAADGTNPAKGRSITPHVDCLSGDGNLKALAILDESIRGEFARRVGRPAVVFPDLTDERMPQTPGESGLSHKLQSFAANRPTVGLFGHLQRSKGLINFCAVAQERALAQVCFAAGGEVDWQSFTPEERRVVQACFADCPNVWTHLAEITDGPRLNGLIAHCTVLFAAYLDFPHSSNILTKAALLEKPVVVSDGWLMAERVRRFRLGEVVPQGDDHAMTAAIVRMVADPARWIAEHEPDWEGYRQRHSFPALKAGFAEMLSPAKAGSVV